MTWRHTLLVPLAWLCCGQVTLQWQAPTTMADGSPLITPDEYHIYYGMQPCQADYMEIVPWSVGVVTHTLPGLPRTEPWYFVITAVGEAESRPSNTATTGTGGSACRWDREGNLGRTYMESISVILYLLLLSDDVDIIAPMPPTIEGFTTP